MNWDAAAQWAVFVLGGLAIWLISDDRDPGRQRWGWLIGLMSQPLWLYATWQSEQWGLFALSFWYLYAWGKGARRRWMF